MAYCHIAHNCTVGNCVIMGNNATLAGHCTVEDFAIIGGLSAYHQFTRIGCYAMVGGMSRVPQDVPPYLIGAGIPFKLGGINRVGLKRRGFNLDVRIALTRAFKILYRSHLHLEEALERIEKELEPIPEILHFLDFCRGTKRGIIGLKGITRGVKSDLDFDRMMENCVSLRGP
jgi:UDP-N-acetylglucosamine acyltransferase